MKKRADFKKEEIINFPDILLADNFEHILLQHLKKLKNFSLDSLLLDFKDCQYMDFLVFQYIISFFYSRSKKNQETYLGIPSDKKVRDFMRIWEFPNAFFSATKSKFSEHIVDEDQIYIGEKQTSFNGIGDVIDTLEYNADWKTGHKGKRNFFSYNTYNLKTGSINILPDKIPSIEGRRWNEDLILKVLEKHLETKNAKDEVGRIIIYESISNAVRHPDAQIIQAVSKFDHGSKLPQDKRHLRICLWDDGKSIVETLKPLIREGKPIRSFFLPLYMSDKIYLNIEDLENKQNKKSLILDQSDNPDKNASDEIILQSSLFPGITRTIAEDVADVAPFDDEKNKMGNKTLYIDKQGMGLYALSKAVLDIYQGSLFIRSGDLFLSMKVAHDTFRMRHHVRYKTKIIKYPKWYPNFVGNLLMISLPLRKGTENIS